MNLIVNGHSTYAYTAGRAFNPAQPTVIFVHGVLNDHSVWILQSRFLAHHGFNVLAIDLPGHGRSAGDAPASVEDAADFIAALMDAAGLQQAALVGHSWGSLIALEAAARLGQRISHLALVGTAFPMRVSPLLLAAAQNNPAEGIHMINRFSHSTLAAPPSVLGPGTWIKGAATALNWRVLTSNPVVNVFHRGLAACDAYQNGLQAINQVSCPVLVLMGQEDQMTPARSGASLVQAARSAGLNVRSQVLPVGHALMAEAPDAVLHALAGFLANRPSQQAA
jgi:pimeloyl-ACP methyl ester carboxylesterase